jgi:hypothetical protein
MGWSYQHGFRGGRDFYDASSGKPDALPTKPLWHEEYFARFLMFCALRFRRREYFEAWDESYRGAAAQMASDHTACTALQFLPWLQAKLWQASVTDDGISAQPVWLGKRTPAAGVVLGPDGPIALQWSEDGRISAPEGQRIVLQPKTVPAASSGGG